MTDALDPPFVHRRWHIDVATVGQGKSGRIEANSDECKAAARSLELLECRALRLDYDIKPLSGARFKLTCDLASEVVQASIVSLEPVPATIEEHTESELVPEGRPLSVDGEGAVDILNAPVIESFADGQIDLGQLAFELLSISLDPYPRKAGETLPEASSGEQQPSPFAALAALRKAQDEP